MISCIDQRQVLISVSQGREIAALFGTNEAVMLSKQHGASRSLFLRQKLIVSDAFRFLQVDYSFAESRNLSFCMKLQSG